MVTRQLKTTLIMLKQRTERDYGTNHVNDSREIYETDRVFFNKKSAVSEAITYGNCLRIH